MTLPKKAFGVKLDKAGLMVGGARNNQERVSRRGIDETFLSDYESTLSRVRVLNQEQEKLKADLKSKTEELENAMEKLNKGFSELKRVVKLEFPVSSWKEFGVEDKH